MRVTVVTFCDRACLLLVMAVPVAVCVDAPNLFFFCCSIALPSGVHAYRTNFHLSRTDTAAVAGSALHLATFCVDDGYGP